MASLEAGIERSEKDALRPGGPKVKAEGPSADDIAQAERRLRQAQPPTPGAAPAEPESDASALRREARAIPGSTDPTVDAETRLRRAAPPS
ncbi:hypothetical protein JW766_00335 [Candidatus Dojkabacteria bacterium]|nr:hypothetical protein [Candidatus Dojkabacteria bacterium]